MAIRCGGVAVTPGNLVFADLDRAVVLLQELAKQAIGKAWEKVEAEGAARDALRSGAKVVETFAMYRIL